MGTSWCFLPLHPDAIACRSCRICSNVEKFGTGKRHVFLSRRCTVRNGSVRYGIPFRLFICSGQQPYVLVRKTVAARSFSNLLLFKWVPFVLVFAKRVSKRVSKEEHDGRQKRRRNTISIVKNSVPWWDPSDTTNASFRNIHRIIAAFIIILLCLGLEKIFKKYASMLQYTVF